MVSAISHDDGGTLMTIEAPAALMSFIVEKGSITVDGVSLTVAAMTEGSFSVALIPQTLDFTTLGLRKPGDTVNLENDVIAKYVERLLEARE
ncbi:MAG: riboflavin synthase [Acidimicrobiia bacterium]